MFQRQINGAELVFFPPNHVLEFKFSKPETWEQDKVPRYFNLLLHVEVVIVLYVSQPNKSMGDTG